MDDRDILTGVHLLAPGSPPLGLVMRVLCVLCWVGCQPEPARSLEDASTQVLHDEQHEAVVPGPGEDAFELRRKAIFSELRGLVAELEAEGRYSCCIKTPCSHCALMASGCSCADGLKRGEPVCEECALMWTVGQGSVEGVEASEVRSFLEAKKAR